MSVISSVKPQKFKKGVNIYLDGVFAFGLDLESYIKLGLKVGTQLTKEEITKITKKSKFKGALEKLIMFASLRPRSQKEINDWMFRKNIDERLKEKLVSKIKNMGLLDDEMFARWWVEQRITFKSKSLKDLNFELRRKGIEKRIILKVLGENKVDENASAKRLIEKNMHRWSRFSAHIARQKKRIFLARKGFTWETIKEAVK